MAGVRSKRLWGPTGITSAGTLLYTAPAGETALIKSIAFGASGGSGSGFTFYIGSVTAAHLLYLVSWGVGNPTRMDGLFWVLQPGEELRAVLNGTGTSYCTGFGAELEGVAD